MKTIGNFPDVASAEAAASLLRGEGIEANIPEEFLASLNWQLGSALRGIRLQVADDDEEAARELLETRTAPDDSLVSPPLASDLCPACGADAVVPAPWKKRAKGAALLFPPLILIYPLLALMNPSNACRACGREWK